MPLRRPRPPRRAWHARCQCCHAERCGPPARACSASPSWCAALVTHLARFRRGLTRDTQVGSSKRLYASFVALCRRHYAKESVLAACSLRSQVLLALHEAKSSLAGGAPLDVSADRCFELARDLDACLKARARQRGARVSVKLTSCRALTGWARRPGAADAHQRSD